MAKAKKEEMDPTTGIPLTAYCSPADVRDYVCAPGEVWTPEGLARVQRCIQDAFQEINQALAKAGQQVPIPETDTLAFRGARHLNALGAAAKFGQADAAIRSYAALLKALTQSGQDGLEEAAADREVAPTSSEESAKG